MRVARIPELGLGLPLLAAALGLLAPSLGATPIADAVALYGQKRYAEAKAILEPLAASEPSNAEASYYLGMAYLRLGGPACLDSSRLWLGRALRLSPDNEGYLSDYAGVCLMLADRDSSFSLALEGRDAMSRAVAANPSDLGACEGLMRFYAKAPWPLGNAERALALAAQIARANPRRGLAAYRSLQATFEKGGHPGEAQAAALAAQSLAQGLPH
jgi:cytochrome c-type biogenesis protein CcmH/NrfG